MKKIDKPNLEKEAGDTKTLTEEVKEFVEKKEKSKNSLPVVEEKYQEICNLNYVRDGRVRQELKELIDALWKIDGLLMQKTSDHDCSVRYKGRQIVKIVPLKNRWSSQIKGGKIQSATKEQILSVVKDEVANQPKTSKQDDEEVIKKLEERIKNMAKGVKGINVKNFPKTKEFKEWIKSKGYKLDKETLFVS